MADLTKWAAPVHKSLQQPDLILGVPKEVFVMLLCAGIVLAALFGLLFAVSSVVFYLPCRLLSKEDPQMLSMALESLLQPDFLEG
jgi:type IV secretory pathway VirB3-like protein